ncbi:MAG: beta-ketoacyl-ACP synthase II [Anaerolineae bacterium]|nr:beta-ketoacyl-ACP synthase II [Anaerolineae bacterium]
MNATNGRRRVVITGLGAVTPLGADVDTTWRELIAGCSGVRTITDYDTSELGTKIAARVKGFNASAYMDPKEARRLSLFIQYGIAAASQAVEHAAIDFAAADPARVGVELGSSLGGTDLVEEQRSILDRRGMRAVNPTAIPAILISSAACAVAIRYGARGPVSVPVNACATGVTAVGEAYRRIIHGDADLIVAGGTDSVLSPLGIAGFGRLGALSTKNDTPESACSPFAAGRDGTVLGEGAAALVLETLEHAQGRGAPILAEVAGYGLTSDAFNMAAPDPEGAGAARAMQQALAADPEAAENLTWICAHGTGTQLNDLSETKAVKRLFGERAYRTPISSIKGGLGHMLGAAGAVSVVAGVKAIETGIIPPTINYAAPDPECDLDYVPNVARRARVDAFMANAFGFGGQNAAVVVKRFVG